MSLFVHPSEFGDFYGVKVAFTGFDVAQRTDFLAVVGILRVTTKELLIQVVLSESSIISETGQKQTGNGTMSSGQEIPRKELTKFLRFFSQTSFRNSE